MVTTDAVSVRTTLLLVRYRFHLTLPSRSGERQVVAEDARLLAYEGLPQRARWLDDDAAAALLGAHATANTHELAARNAITRALDGLPASPTTSPSTAPVWPPNSTPRTAACARPTKRSSAA